MIIARSGHWSYYIQRIGQQLWDTPYIQKLLTSAEDMAMRYHASGVTNGWNHIGCEGAVRYGVGKRSVVEMLSQLEMTIHTNNR